MQNALSSFITFLKGIVIGVANIIPGVSGGTMAVVMGIYDRLIGSISGFFSDKGKRGAHFGFLVLIAVGAVVGLKGLAPIITFCLDNHNELTMLFFMGLIAGSMPTVIELSGVKKLRLSDMVWLAVGVALVLVLGAGPENKESIEASAQGAGNTMLLVSGILAGGAMIVPGVSGSLILVLLGAYPVVLHAVDKLDFSILGIVAVGVALGIVLFSVAINFLLKHFANATHSFIFGLVGASVIILFAGFPEGNWSWLAGSASFIVGAVVSYAPSLKAPAKA